MHIDGWSIDAFGALHDVERRGLGDGLTVIYGPNEAGKSTLRHFVLGVLFGFSTGKSSLPPYTPSSGAARSGRLFIESDGEEFVLSRLEKRGVRKGAMTLLGPDGTARSDAELSALLGGLTRGVYDRVFAVGLDELNDLDALTDGDLQDHLLSAGVTGAGRIATQARGRLRARAEALHKSRSSATEVAEIREALRTVEDQLRDAQQAAHSLGELREVLAAKHTRASELAAGEQAARGLAQRAERLLELWPHHLEAVAAVSALEELGEEEHPLPANAAETLANRLARLDAAGADVDQRRRDLDQALDQLRVVDAGHLPDLAALQPDIAALQHRLGAWGQQEEEMLNRREELAELNRRLEFELDVIGIDDPSELARIGAVVAARDHLRVTRGAFDDKAAALRRASEVVEHHQSELIEAGAAVESATAALHDQAIDTESGSVRIASERAAREALLLGELSSELSELEQRRRDLAVAEGKLRGAADEGASGRSMLEPRKILAVAALVLAGSAVVAGIMSGAVAGIALAVAAAITGGCAYALRDTGGGRLTEDSREGLVAVSNALERRCSDRASMLGFPSLPTVDEVAEQKAVRDRQAADFSNLLTAQLRLETARNAAKSNKARLAELTHQHEVALGAWQDWLDQHALPSVLRPEGVDEWLSHLDQARALDEQIRQAERRERELSGALEHAPKEVIELTERAERASHRRGGDDGDHRLVPGSITPPGVDSSVGELQAVVAAIAEVVGRAVETDREVSRIQDQIDVLRGELERATNAKQSAGADLTAYFASAGVLNETQFRARIAERDRRLDLERVIAEFDRRIETSSGAHADDDRVALGERSPDVWETNRSEAITESAELAAARDELLQEIGALESDVQAIEVSGDLPSLALQREELVERLRRALREWTVLHTAAGLIGHTLDRYLEERQPAVLQRAETHLVTITEGRYTTIRLDPDAATSTPRLMVVDAKGRSHEPRGLSRGTVEQVYLCLRLALAEQHRPALPLLLDDILVNFDPIRAETTTRVLADIAANQQVIVYTCHPWVVEIMQSVVADLGLVDLEKRVA